MISVIITVRVFIIRSLSTGVLLHLDVSKGKEKRMWPCTLIASNQEKQLEYSGNINIHIKSI